MAMLVVVVLVVVAGAWLISRRQPADEAQRAPEPTYPTFAPDNVYAVDISQAPVDQRSAGMIEHLTAEVASRYNGVATFNVEAYGVNLFEATPQTPKVQVVYRDCGKRGYVPEGLYDGAKHFVDVPIPPQAVPMDGEDGQLSVWAPHEDRLWEFWVARKLGDTWEACWGGRIDNVSKNRGYFEPPFGVNASGLVMTESMVTVAEAQSGRIEHAVALAIPAPADYFVYPAQRTDGGSGESKAIPEGARLRLDPALDVDSLTMTPVAKAIAHAAQRYGFIVTDRSGGVSVIAEGGAAHRLRTGSDPWKAILNGTPTYEVLAGFPWDRLQVISLGYRP